MQLVLVFGHQGDEARIEIVVGGLFDENSYRSSLEGVSRYLFRLWKQFEEAEERPMGDCRERVLVRRSVVEETNCHLDHFGVVEFVDHHPIVDAMRIGSRCLGETPFDDDSILLRVVLEKRLAEEANDVVVTSSGFEHQVHHDGECLIVVGQSFGDEKTDLLTSDWHCLDCRKESPVGS